MRQKINLVIHSSGENNRLLLDCIGSMNGGKSSFSARDVEGYLNIQKAFLPITGKGYCLIKDENEPETYHVSDDGGKTFTLSLEWVEIHSLPEVDTEIEDELNTDNAGFSTNDLKNVL